MQNRDDNTRTPRPFTLLPLLLLAAAFPIRFTALGTTLSVFEVVLAAAGCLWLVAVLYKGSTTIPTRYLTLGYVSITLTVASLLWTQELDRTIAATVSTVLAVLAFLVVVSALRYASARKVALIIAAFVVLLTIPGALMWAGVQGLEPPAELDRNHGDYLSYYTRFSHPFIGRSNNLAALLVAFLPPMIVWTVRTRHRAVGLATLIGAGALVLTLSRGTFLALGLALFAYMLIDSKQGRAILRRLVLLAIPVGLVAWILFGTDPFRREQLVGRLATANLDERREFLSYAQAQTDERPLVGLGARAGQDVHNTYLQQVVDFGIIGGTLVVILLLATALWWFGPHHGQSRWLARAAGIGVLAQLLSFAVESSYEGTLLRPLIWLTWGMLVAWVYAEQRGVGDDAPPEVEGVRTGASRSGART